MSVIQRGIKNAFRNGVRTFSIVLILGLSIGLALTMLMAKQAVDTKIKSVTGSIGNTVSVSPAGMRGFEGGGEPLTDTQATSLEKLEHVTSVTKTINDRADSDSTNLVSAIEAGSLGRRFSGNQVEPTPPRSNDELSTDSSSTQTVTRSFTPPITVLGTSEPTNLSSTQGGGTLTINSGQVFESDSSENVAMIGSTLATKNNLSVGSVFTLHDATIKVVAIFDAGNDFSNNQVIMPIKSVQKLTSQVGQFTSLTVNVDSVTNIDAVTTNVKSVLGDNADVTNAAERAKEAITPLENIKSISVISLIGSLVAGAVIILLTMMMIVRERRREIGVLKAIGATNLIVMTQFIIESLTLTLMGALVGLGIGILGSGSMTNLLVKTSTASSQGTGQMGGQRGFGRMMDFAGQGVNGVRNLQATVGWDIVLYGLGVAVLIAILGSAMPAWLISKVRPAEVMRAE